MKIKKKKIAKKQTNKQTSSYIFTSQNSLGTCHTPPLSPTHRAPHTVHRMVDSLIASCRPPHPDSTGHTSCRKRRLHP